MRPIRFFDKAVAFAWVLCMVCGSFVNGEESAQSQKVKVFLMGGQSNMDGRGDGSALTDKDRQRLKAIQGRVLFAYNRQEPSPLDVTQPLPHVAKKFNLEKTFGPELFFGIELAEALPGEKILFIKRSEGGRSLYGAWNPEWSEEKAKLMKEEKKTKFYSDFVGYAKEVLADYNNYEICGMLWVQGETDAGKRRGPKPADEYEANLKKLIHSVRRDFHAPELPFMILQVSGGKVAEAMKKTATEDPHVIFIPQSRNPDDPNFFPKYGPPHGHYNYHGMKKIGELFARNYLKIDSKSGGEKSDPERSKRLKP